MRRLRHHEQKLLKKTDFFNWEREDKDLPSLYRYHIEKRTDYVKYKEYARKIRELSISIKDLKSTDKMRDIFSKQLVNKCYEMGIINTKASLSLCRKVNAENFCRRRISTMLLTFNMAQYAKSAVQMVEHGHVRIGLEVVKDPAFHVTREMEDYLTWAHGSKYLERKDEFDGKIDDFAKLM
ncbi:MAG: Small subunit (SSU) processome component [Marteilia pararefringens]